MVKKILRLLLLCSLLISSPCYSSNYIMDCRDAANTPTIRLVDYTEKGSFDFSQGEINIVDGENNEIASNQISINFRSSTGIAQIGTTVYPSLQLAIDAATATDEIKLLQNTFENIDLSKTIKLNGDNFTMGNLTVNNTGKITFTGSININELAIKSSAVGSTGQILVEIGIQTAQKTRFDRESHTDTHISNMWYAFGVPFGIDDVMSAGSVYKTGANTQAEYIKDFALNVFDAQRRADYGSVNDRGEKNQWQYTTLMTKGLGYQLYLRDETSRVLSFYASNPNEIFSPNTTINYTSTTGLSEDVTNYGWNFLSQPLTSNATIAFSTDITKIQVLRNGSNNEQADGGKSYYSTINLNEVDDQVLAPFSAFVIQTANAGQATFTPSDNAPTIRSTEHVVNNEFTLEFKNSAGFTDKLFISASVDALQGEYELGKDLLKAGVSTGLPQIYSKEFGEKLVMNNGLFENGEAYFALGLNIPTTDTYTITATRLADSGTLYLLKNNAIIQNLNEKQEYSFTANKSEINDYSLMIKAGADDDIVTDIEESEQKASFTAYINNGILTISDLTEGTEFTIGNAIQTLYQGVSTGSTQTFELPQQGFYWVSAAGKTIKLIRK